MQPMGIWALLFSAVFALSFALDFLLGFADVLSRRVSDD